MGRGQLDKFPCLCENSIMDTHTPTQPFIGWRVMDVAVVVRSNGAAALTLTGANGKLWNESKRRAVCYQGTIEGNPDKSKIFTRGKHTLTEHRQSAYDLCSAHIGAAMSGYNAHSICGCGIYAFNSVESMAQDSGYFNRSRFQRSVRVMLECVMYGTVAEYDRGYKATDCLIQTMTLILPSAFSVPQFHLRTTTVLPDATQVPRRSRRFRRGDDVMQYKLLRGNRTKQHVKTEATLSWDTQRDTIPHSFEPQVVKSYPVDLMLDDLRSTYPAVNVTSMTFEQFAAIHLDEPQDIRRIWY